VRLLFYHELSKYILDDKKRFKPIDELIFFKIRYYAIKFLDILNDGQNFLEDERQHFIKNKYDKAIIALSKSQFHDAEAKFYYNNGVLQISFKYGPIERKFEFHGIEEWSQREFMKINPKLVAEELYEESNRIFIYNTLWTHEDVGGVGCSELTVRFVKAVELK